MGAECFFGLLRLFLIDEGYEIILQPILKILRPLDNVNRL
jgi:hypothetical protein